MMRSETYKKHTPLEHILARPDTYVGSIETDIDTQWVLDDSGKMIRKQIEHIPGLYKIYDEILVNALDQCTIDKTIDAIKIEVNQEKGSISIMNTGNGIPVEIHPEYKVYTPELIFGELLTSSNYDDNVKRTTGGRNGYGAKLANIFSTLFEVETVDVQNQLKYVQTFSNNMKNKTKPSITKKKCSNGYAKFTFTPDLPRFGMKSLTGDIVSLFEKRAYDACACTPSTVKVFYNGKQLSVKSFEKYCELYIGSKQTVPRILESSPCKRWEICVAPSDSFKQVSFVNGINTSHGGSHVESVLRQIITKLTEYIQNKHKCTNIRSQFIKDHLFIFVKCTLVNPTFSSQTKTECTSKYSTFGSKFEVDDEFIKKLSKLSIVNDIVALAKHKEMRELNKTDGKKHGIIKSIPKLDDANRAGSSISHKCTLILTEGDSAKTFAISGLSVVGRDYYGVFPLKGKLLNVREATAKQLLDNAEINQLKQILGLQQGKKYNSLNELRYGSIMIITDADVDGSHIKGLIVNFIHHFWPSLMEHDFIKSMITPVIKANKGNKTEVFYNLSEYTEWKNTHSGWNIKYYKGLGTSTANEAKEYFRNLQNSTVVYENTEECTKNIELAFKKTMADERKSWIQSSIKNQQVIPHDKKIIKYSEFINKDLVWFSIADVVRSIPCMVDGMKPSQRKVLHACRLRANTEIKVSQLAGFISTKTSYHHGENSLMGAIVSMAQDFVGSNTYNLLLPKGQFGTRLMGGKDSASPRYIFTKLSEHANKLFMKQDDDILAYLNDDGFKIEPKYFVPTLPVVLINGGEGIGTGYSSNIPSYNPVDIKENIKLILTDKSPNEIHPWYPKFKGTISKVSDTSYLVTGVYSLKRGVIEVTELPIGKWTNDYKEFLDGLVDTTIESYENHSTEEDVHFKIKMKDAESVNVVKTFKLTSTINTSNMHLFNSEGRIHKYTNPNEIIGEFVQIRLEYYEKRKKHFLAKMKRDQTILNEKIRFIHMIINEELIIFKKKKEEITKQLHSLKFKTVDGSYDYLLKMEIYNLTSEKISEYETTQTKLNNDIQSLSTKTPKSLWEEDLA